MLVGHDASGQPITRSIEDLREGDLVLSRDQHDAGDGIELRRIAAVLVKTSDHVRVLRIQDADGNVETIRTTDEHPFYIAGLGWVRAGELVAGQRLNEADGTHDAMILSTERQEHPAGITVYNLTVEGDHTYFVDDGDGAATMVWVHNTYDSRILGNNLGGRKIMTALGYEAHHIIPVRLEAAKRLQNHLRKLKIDINEKANGVWLAGPKIGGNHRMIHTKPYIERVEMLVLQENNPATVRRILQKIGDQLQSGAFHF